MNKRKTDSCSLLSPLLSEAADGTTDWTIFSSVMSYASVQHISVMVEKATVCLQDMSEGGFMKPSLALSSDE